MRSVAHELSKKIKLNHQAHVPAEAFLVARITLKAKRLMAHTPMPIGLISGHIGFDETTNFVKFFKPEDGCSRGEFRNLHSEGTQS